MAKVLYVVGNPMPEEHSVSKQVGNAFIDAYRAAAPADEITIYDVYSEDVPFIDGDVLGAWGALRNGATFDSLTAEQQAKLGRLNQIVDEFVTYDKFVFVTPLWNFSVPAKMKAFIDAVSVAGKTFKYSEQGPIGLLKGKQAIHIQARGGVYTNTPFAPFEHGDALVSNIFTFFGMTAHDSIITEGHAYAPQEAEAIKGASIENARAAAKKFAEALVTA